MKSYKYIISGKVQGVYYRANIQKNALQHGYSGYVRNLSDGTVEAAVTCKESKLNNFIYILKQGSIYSDVQDINQLESDEIFSGKFEIK